MKKHSNRLYNKILKRKCKEQLRRKYNKQQLKEKSNVINFDEIDFGKITIEPFKKNDVITMKILHDDKPLIIKTPTITIGKSYTTSEPTSNNLSIKLTFDETNKEHKTFLDMLSEIDECFSHDKFCTFPRYQYKKNEPIKMSNLNVEPIKITRPTTNNEHKKRENGMYFWSNI